MKGGVEEEKKLTEKEEKRMEEKRKKRINKEDNVEGYQWVEFN